MIETAVAQLLFKLVVAIGGILAVRATLMWMDRHFDLGFKSVFNDADANARLYYFAARFIAVCIVVGLALS